jgi:hypothetical protein
MGMSKEEKEITAKCSKRVKGSRINIELNAEDTSKMEFGGRLWDKDFRRRVQETESKLN